MLLYVHVCRSSTLVFIYFGMKSVLLDVDTGENICLKKICRRIKRQCKISPRVSLSITRRFVNCIDCALLVMKLNSINCHWCWLGLSVSLVVDWL